MKRDRLDSSSSSPPPPSSMSKRSRSSTLGRYGDLNDGSSDDGGNSPNGNESSSGRRHHGGGSTRDHHSSHHHHHHSRSSSGGGGHRNSSSGRRGIGGGGGGGGGVSPPRGGGGGGGAAGRDYGDGGGGGYRGNYKDGRGAASSSSISQPPSSASSASQPYPYKVLCISSLHPKASDEVVRETLYREFKRFGDISVKVVHEPDERVAYVYFRSYEDARDAKHSKSRIIIYDKPVMVEAAYESLPPSYNNRGGGTGGAVAGGHHASSAPAPKDHYGDKYYSGGGSAGGVGGGSRRSPIYDGPPPSSRGMRGDPDHHHSNRYDRYDSGRGGGSSMAPPPGPPGGPPMYRDYRGGRGDHHHPMNDYSRGGMSGGGNVPHYSRYPPRGGSGSSSVSSSGPPPPHHHQPPPHHHHHGPPGGPPPPGPPHHHGPPGGPPPPGPPHHHGGPQGPGGPHYGGPPGGPPHHHVSHHHMEPPHHHHHGGGGPPHLLPPPQAPPRYENKKDKFPNYLQHVSPEDDPLATRTLFAGNLEVNITDEELRRIFGRYGTVEDIDIKRPPPGTGNAYAFVRFVNLDMAARAKSELSGQYIGKFQCKIGYGKVNPTTKMWIGGLGDWTTSSSLEREFDRFGSIKKIEWIKGEPYAYITFETIDAAQAAVKDMRGYPLGGTDKRIRTDFADAASPPIGSHLHNLPGMIGSNGGGSGGKGRSGGGGEFDRESGGGGVGGSNDDMSGCGSESGRNDSAVVGQGAPTRGGPGSTHSGGTDLACTSPGQSDNESVKSLGNIKTIHDIPRKVGVSWSGALILKNSSFPSRLHLTEGDFEGIELLMKDEECKNQLRITQRLRLDQSKLDDVLKRISTSTHHGVFLALPCSTTATSNEPNPDEDSQNSSNNLQSRPLRNLVSYLKQKEAAGVISLAVAKDPSTTGVLYAFPPCPFSFELLKKQCPGITGDVGADGKEVENHLVIVVIRGGNV